jgi:hypothetical protein
MNDNDVKGHGEFIESGKWKHAWKVKIRSTKDGEDYEVKWCVKAGIKPGYDLAFDVEMGQMACMTFYEMVKYAEKKHITVPGGYSRPRLCHLPMQHYDTCLFYNPDVKNCFSIESLLNGTFARFVSQSGLTCDHSSLDVCSREAALWAATFMHWSWEYFDNNLVVCDIQGDHTGFTDCVVHTLDGNAGDFDHGQAGIVACRVNHVCNIYCVQLGLGKSTLPRSAMPRELANFAERFSTTRKR